MTAKIYRPGHCVRRCSYSFLGCWPVWRPSSTTPRMALAGAGWLLWRIPCTRNLAR
ncbi:hypothetical protein PCLA_10r0099 [Pseudomonas citronellolis]|nr:hypothetical protein PCLA_10r0099 [Pseudomonas citronellolis]